jgi:hypothetical protein
MSIYSGMQDMDQDVIQMQEMNSTYLFESCHLSEEGWMQDAVCDVLLYSPTKHPCMQLKLDGSARVR